MQSVLTCTQLYQLWTMLWYRNQPLLFINVHHCMYIVHTCLYMVQTCLSCFMSVYGSSWFTHFCWKHFSDVCCLYSPVLCCTSFEQGYGTGMLFINVHHCMYIVHTCLYMVQTCSSCFMSVHGSSWFTRFCWKYFRDVCRLYSPVLSCTSFRQCYGTGISHLVHRGYVNVWTL